jgi:hypothetical protein
MKQSQSLRLLRFARNDCKYFCPSTYHVIFNPIIKVETGRGGRQARFFHMIRLDTFSLRRQ